MVGRMAIGAVMAVTMGCAPVPPPDLNAEVPEKGAAGRCDAGRVQKLVGQAATQALGAEAMRLTGAGGLRWIPEGSAVTMDYRPDRLNINLDRRNRVTRIHCG